MKSLKVERINNKKEITVQPFNYSTVKLPNDNLPQAETNNSHKKVAFTLAEVLITLGIIGVVAALTIPALINNYQIKSWNTASTVFEGKLVEALKIMNTQQTLAGHKTTKDFTEELSKHFSITKICDEVSECFDDSVIWEIIDLTKKSETEELTTKDIKTAMDLGQSEWNTEALGVQFANGITGILAYNPKCVQNPYSNVGVGTSCISLIYDVNGFKSPNTTTKDVRGINSIINKCAFKSNGVCFGTPFYPEPLTNMDCLNDKEELGIEKCYGYDADYWLGAVKTCGGISKMVSLDQLAEIASAVYGTEVIWWRNLDNANLNADMAAQLGFKINADNSFNVWVGSEVNFGRAYIRVFTPSSTYSTYHSRTISNYQAICVED